MYSSRSYKRFLTTVSLIFFTFFLIQTPLFSSFQSRGFTVISTGQDYTELEFTLPDYEVITVEVDGVKYYRIMHPEGGFLMNEGLPELLTFSTMLSIPRTGTAELGEINVKASETLNNTYIFPSQGFNLEINEEKGFLKDELFYSKDTAYPELKAQISSPAIMRDIRLISLSVNPFSYNPAKSELTIINRLTITVNYDFQTPGENEIINPRRTRSRSFESVYRNSAVNYGQFRNPNEEYQARSILVIHNHSADATFLSLINQFTSWKRDKGFEIATVNTQNLTTPQAMKNYIQNAYDTWEHPPEYIVIVGGKTGTISVPVWTIYDSDAYIPGNSDGDHPFTTLAGNDILPEAFIGRLSVGSVDQLATAWAKIRNYERTPYFEVDNNWYNHNLLVGDPGVSGISTIISNKYLKELMLSHNSNKTFAEVYTAPFPAQMQNGVNQGVAYFAFRGLENFAGWVSPTEGDLYNGLKLPHTTIITCRTVDFSGGKQVCRLYRMGTPVQPKGIMTGIGMSWVTETAFNNCLHGGIFAGIFAGGLRTMGEALVNGKLNQWQTYSNSHAWQLPRYFHQANLIGDPSLDIWVGTPEALTVTYPEQLPQGSNSIQISVGDSENRPVEEAWVTIRQGEDVIFVSGYTDAAGVVTYFFDPARTGEVKVTVTKPEYIPHLGNFTLTATPAVAYNDVVVNGNLNAGNNVNFVIRAKNHRNQAVNGINGSISTNSNFIEITNANSPFGNIAANTVVAGTSNFSINIAPHTPAGHRALFNLTLTDNAQNSWLSRFILIINNGDLAPVNLVIQDGNDGILDPTEEAVLRVYVQNRGEVNLQGIVGTITGGGYGLNILEDTAIYPAINAGQTATSSEQHFEVATTSYVIPGMIFNLTLTLTNEAGFHQTHQISLPIGSPEVTDPLGPDAYGYWCYDQGDINYDDAPVYDWIEIVPQLGGNGVNTNLISDFNNVQNTVVRDLPFTFRFYGKEYDVISICANGWISFSPTEQATQRNWRLPGPLGASPMIAAFWDNLNLAAGGVYTWYDEINSLYVIQWQNARNVIQNAEETFQIILYDPEFYHTATSDGPIKIQYKVFNNLNNGANTPTGIGNWGNYCSIGLEDHTGLIGLEYTFNNRYPTAARPLSNESALYFTTGSVTNAPYVAIESFSYSDGDNDLPEYGENGTLNLTLANIGGQDAEGVTAVLSSVDEYVNITQNQAQFGDIPSQGTSTINNAYNIEIAENVPHQHKIFFNLNINEANNISWNFRFHITANAPYVVIDTLTVTDGNNNVPEFGETIQINMSLLNNGGSGSRNVAGVLTSEDEYITIIDGNADYQGIGVDETTTVNGAYTILIANNIPNMHRAHFDLAITAAGEQSWNDQFHLDIKAPVLVSATPYIFDPLPGGNNNGMIDPGETVFVYLPLINEGGANSPSVSITVESGTDLVTVNEVLPSVFNTVLTSDILYPAVSITVSEQADTGTPLPFNYTYETGEYTFNGNFLLGVGGIVPAQMGTGNAVTTNSTASPINIYFKSLRGQMVYTAEEFNSLGISVGGQINQIGFYVTGAPQYPLIDFTVRMSHTTSVDASEHIDGPYSTVYVNPGFAPVAGGWAMMELNPPFMWNGVDNLLVDTSFAPVAGWSSSGQIRIYNVPNGFRFTRADNINQINIPTITATADKPQALILFGMGGGGTRTRPQFLETFFDGEVVALSWLAPLGDRGISNAGRNRAGVTSPRDGLNQRNPLGYNVYRNGRKINETLVDETNYIDETFNYRTTCYYYVTAVYENMESPPSNIVAMDFDIVAHPQILPINTIQYEPFYVTLATETEDAAIYYTLDGSEPTTQSILYETSFELNYHNVVKAKAFRDGWVASDITGKDYYVLYSPQNIRSSGSFSTANLYWEEPWSPQEGNMIMNNDEWKPTRRIRRDERKGDTARSLLGYNIYRSYSDEDFILVNEEPVIETEYEDIDLEEGSYRYFVKAVYEQGLSQPTRTVNVNVGTTSVEEEENIPLYITELLNAYPNPFNPETVIHFTLRNEEKVSIEVYNILGRRVKTVLNEVLPAGKQRIVWAGDDNNGNRLSSGIYLYRMTTPDYSAVKKIIMLK